MTYTAVNEQLAANLRAERARKGWTQKQLASASGVTERTVSNIEAAKHGTTVFQMVLFAQALGIPVSKLVPDMAAAHAA